MAAAEPKRKIPKEVLRCLKDNGFTFDRYNGHAIYKHTSGQIVVIPVSKGKRCGSFNGKPYYISQIKKVVEGSGKVFVG
jgi:predicted RNA binding protein YcfA (HicA-like mRNA interferase family)